MHLIRAFAVCLLPLCASASSLHGTVFKRQWYVRGGDTSEGPGAYAPQGDLSDMSSSAAPGDQSTHLPEGWAQYVADDGVPYYHHAASGTTQWEMPQASAAQEEAMQAWGSSGLQEGHTDGGADLNAASAPFNDGNQSEEGLRVEEAPEMAAPSSAPVATTSAAPPLRARSLR